MLRVLRIEPPFHSLTCRVAKQGGSSIVEEIPSQKAYASGSTTDEHGWTRIRERAQRRSRLFSIILTDFLSGAHSADVISSLKTQLHELKCTLDATRNEDSRDRT